MKNNRAKKKMAVLAAVMIFGRSVPVYAASPVTGNLGGFTVTGSTSFASTVATAYSSPAWPSSQLTNVSGNWIISIPDGAFIAEATVSALVQGAPLMWTLYDVSYMDGTHK